MTSLLLGLYTVETILRVPILHPYSIQLRPGAPALLQQLSEHVKSGKMEVALLTPHSDFFAPRLLAPISERFPEFHILSGSVGGAGGAIIERHWRERAMARNSSSSMRILLAGTRKGLVSLWRSDEVVVLDPFVALSKQDRDVQREEMKRLGLKRLPDDHSMRNLGGLVNDVLSTPDTPVGDILRTSPWCKHVNYKLLGDTFHLASD